MIDVTAMLFCFIKHTLGNCYGPGGSFKSGQGARTHEMDRQRLCHLALMMMIAFIITLGEIM